MSKVKPVELKAVDVEDSETSDEREIEDDGEIVEYKEKEEDIAENKKEVVVVDVW